jgi:hypothetical protein
MSRKTIKKNCEYCKSEFDAVLSEHNRGNAKFCSSDCSAKHKKTKTTQPCLECGAETKSGNKFCNTSCAAKYNNRARPEESRQKQRETVSKTAALSHPKLIKICEHCKKEFTTRRKHQKCCSNNCSAINKNKEARNNRPDLLNYRSDCSFKFGIRNFPNEFDFSLVEQYGWYKAANRGNNLNGISRDHMVSVKWGFENNIDPKIISHPANCRLIRHNDNVSKGKTNFITYEELITRIIIWNLTY